MTTEHEPGDQPLFWRVAEGVLYAEMPYGRNVRPPLLTEWEGARVEQFNDAGARSRWLAGRTLAKALVRERLGVSGLVEIRENAAGQPLLFQGGLPVVDIWLGIQSRHGRIAAVVADRPVGLDLRLREGGDAAREKIGARVTERGELRTLTRLLGDRDLATAAAWSVKEAALRALRVDDGALSDVNLQGDLSLRVGERHLHALAVRVLGDVVVTIAGRPLLHEKTVTRVVLDSPAPVPTAVPEPAQGKLQAAVERSMARARRIADARARWAGRRPGWQTGQA